MAFRVDLALPLAQRDQIVSDLRQLQTASTFWETSGDSLWELNQATPVLTAAERLGLMYWVVGGWGLLQAYLRGGLPPLVVAGGLAAATIHGVVFPAATYPNRVTEVDNGIAALPDYAYPSFRQAGRANANVYTTLTDPGDYLSAPTYFASSRIKGAGAAGGGGNWGAAGNTIYTMIRGTHGKNLGGFSDIGSEREVLFGRGSIFQVEGILTLLGNTNVFVVVNQVAALPLGVASKDPYTGL